MKNIRQSFMSAILSAIIITGTLTATISYSGFILLLLPSAEAASPSSSSSSNGNIGIQDHLSTELYYPIRT